MPYLAQIAPVYGLTASDFDNDGILDLVLGGNLYGTRVKLGRFDASKGEFFKGVGDGSFETLPYSQSGCNSLGQTRDIVQIKVSGETHLIFSKNNAPIDVYKLK